MRVRVRVRDRVRVRGGVRARDRARANPHSNPNSNPNQVCLFAAGVAAHQMRELGAPTCAATADAAAEQLQATLLYLVTVLG